MNHTNLIRLSAAALLAFAGQTAVADTEDSANVYTFASFTYMANLYQPIELIPIDVAPADGGVDVFGEAIPLDKVQVLDLIYQEQQYFAVLPQAALESAPVPIPAAVWLFGSALAGLGVFGKRRMPR